MEDNFKIDKTFLGRFHTTLSWCHFALTIIHIMILTGMVNLCGDIASMKISLYRTAHTIILPVKHSLTGSTNTNRSVLLSIENSNDYFMNTTQHVHAVREHIDDIGPGDESGQVNGQGSGSGSGSNVTGFRHVPVYVNSGEYINPAELLLFVFAWTAVFHLIYMLQYASQNYAEKWQTEVNYVSNMRWIEYSVSAPLMIAVVACSVGMRDVTQITCLCVLTALTMAFGFWSEIEIKKYVDHPPKKSLPDALLFSAMIGIVPHTYVWSTLFSAYDDSVAACESVPNLSIPDFVHTILVCEFFLFTLFAVWHFLRLLSILLHQENSAFDNKTTELGYASLSLISKAFLGIMLCVYAFSADKFEKAFSA
tara:strand:+ start:147 stop:1244 length:1098 start_codon:yes stop_codon:yes gene_type:complete